MIILGFKTKNHEQSNLRVTKIHMKTNALPPCDPYFINSGSMIGNSLEKHYFVKLNLG